MPLDCASAATRITLGADEVLMRPTACLTAVDTALNHSLSPPDLEHNRANVSLDGLTRVIRLRRTESGSPTETPYKSPFADVQPLVIGAVDRAESLSTRLCRELLAHHIHDPMLLNEARKMGLRASALPPKVCNSLLLELNRRYGGTGLKATPDCDEICAQGDEILNILEGRAVQIDFQDDKDRFCRTEERRRITMNDNCGWRCLGRRNGRRRKRVLHIAQGRVLLGHPRGTARLPGAATMREHPPPPCPVLARMPAALEGEACICRRCAEGTHGDRTPEGTAG